MTSAAALPRVTIYSDGGCIKNPGGCGGWAAILTYGGKEKVVRGNHPSTTNNRMELTAAIEALKALKRPCSVDFFTDSQYLQKGISLWLKHWARRDWKTKENQPVRNQDLWKELHALASVHRVTWSWVKGHSRDRLNERCDRIVRREIRKMVRFQAKQATGSPGAGETRTTERLGG